MINFIVIGILVVMLGSAIFYIVREKKRGVKCIGCPVAGTCPHSCKGKEHAGGNCDRHPKMK